jgi:hypothetical protein
MLYPIHLNKGVSDLAIPTTTKYTTPTTNNAAAIQAEIARKAAAGIPLAGDQNGNVSAANQAAYDAALKAKTATPIATGGSKTTQPVTKSVSSTPSTTSTASTSAALPAWAQAVKDMSTNTSTSKAASFSDTPSKYSTSSVSGGGGGSEDISSQIAAALQGLNLDGLIGGLQSQYDDKFSSLERMLGEQNTTLKTQYETQAAAMQKQYDELMNKYNYTNSQANPSVNSNALDGVQLADGTTTPVTGGSASTGVSNDANSALYRYLNNLWGGGF